MNLTFDNGFVAICFGYPPNSVFKQSIYTGFEEINKKINNAEKIIHKYKQELDKFREFEPAKTNLKWIIDKRYSQKEIDEYFEIFINTVYFCIFVRINVLKYGFKIDTKVG